MSNKFIPQKKRKHTRHGLEGEALYRYRIQLILDDERLTTAQRTVLTRWNQYEEAQGRSGKSRGTYLRTMQDFAIKSEWDLDQATLTEAHLISWSVGIRVDPSGKTTSPHTRNNKRVVVKKFLKWLYDDDLPKFSRKYFKGEQLPIRNSEVCIAPDQIDLLVEAASDGPTKIRDQALIRLQYETAARINEVLQLQLGSFEYHEDGTGTVHMLNSKTERLANKTRPIPITVYSLMYVRRLIESLDTQDPDTYLFQASSGTTTHLNYSAWWRRFKFIIASLDSPLRDVDGDEVDWQAMSHVLRHSRLTYLVETGFQEVQLRLIAGWAKGSNMIARYFHPTDEKKKQMLRRALGFEILDGEKLSPQAELTVDLVPCPKCETPNLPDTRFCVECRHDMTKEDELLQMKGELAEQRELIKRLTFVLEQQAKATHGEGTQFALPKDLPDENEKE